MKKITSRKRKEVIVREGSVVKRGRPPIVRKPGEKITNNGLFERQWDWIQKEAQLNQQVGAQYLRWLVDVHIDSIEASRNSPVVAVEEDQRFELVKQSKNGKKIDKSQRSE